jgi:hypothetical protein
MKIGGFIKSVSMHGMKMRLGRHTNQTPRLGEGERTNLSWGDGAGGFRLDAAPADWAAADGFLHGAE